MRRWVVKKTDTADAIVAAVINGSCTTDAQVEEIAARYGDTVEWREAKEVEGMKEYIDQEPDRRISSRSRREITLEMVVEDAVGDLFEAHRFFSCLWDQYFSYLDKPNWWETFTRWTPRRRRRTRCIWRPITRRAGWRRCRGGSVLDTPVRFLYTKSVRLFGGKVVKMS